MSSNEKKLINKNTEERILTDFLEKEKMFTDEKQIDKNKIAIKTMYDWLYKKGILEKESFVFKNCKEAIFFSIDTKKLEKYRKDMENSDVSYADIAVNLIFDSKYTPCVYSGTFQLSLPMITYRSHSGCVGRSWECSMIKLLSNKSANEIAVIKKERGIKAAVNEMYKMCGWD